MFEKWLKCCEFIYNLMFVVLVCYLGVDREVAHSLLMTVQVGFVSAWGLPGLTAYLVLEKDTAGESKRLASLGLA